jgi:hypothetical protein
LVQKPKRDTDSISGGDSLNRSVGFSSGSSQNNEMDERVKPKAAYLNPKAAGKNKKNKNSQNPSKSP